MVGSRGGLAPKAGINNRQWTWNAPGNDGFILTRGTACPKCCDENQSFPSNLMDRSGENRANFSRNPWVMSARGLKLSPHRATIPVEVTSYFISS
jgi:hypothetical protein